MKKRLFIVSNRLPVNIINENEVHISSGGLISAISSYMDSADESIRTMERIWVGVPGCSAAAWGRIAHSIPDSCYQYLPVFMNKKTYDGYYYGLANSTIWPLFHYFPSFAEFNTRHYHAYKLANELFAEQLAAHLRPWDTVWIHDYHLLPLAGMLRQKFPGLTIGFFLHIPFPSFEIFRVMPKNWQREMIEGMLGADLLGFHTIDYATHFLRSAQMTLGIDHDIHTIRYNNRLVKVDIFPISIDFEKFHHAGKLQAVTQRRDALARQINGRRIIFSVDRLDYTKGVQNRLKAYEHFLVTNPQFREQVVFILVVVPSRDVISRYAERKKMIDEYIGDINSRIGTITWQPVVYQYNHLEFEELAALYTLCDLALITPLRDGMNLVAKEFVASRKDKKGVLVLSEMAGAARELTDALFINPNDTEEIAQKIKQALEMPLEEQEQRMSNMQQRIREYDVRAWANDFFEQLERIKKQQRRLEVKFIDETVRTQLRTAYKQSTKRLLLLDYDGTLVPFASHPSQAAPNSNLVELLSDVSADSRNHVYIISGRDGQTLEKWLGHLPVNIVAEHGAYIRPCGDEWRVRAPESKAWIQTVRGIMNDYTRRCNHSFTEEKNFSIAWHYRNADEEQGALRAAELYNELLDYTNSMNIQVIPGHKLVEVRNKGINKATAVEGILEGSDFDFILCCGDDVTDEDMFSFLVPVPQAFTIKVGTQASYARYNLQTPGMVLSLLEALLEMSAADCRD